MSIVVNTNVSSMVVQNNLRNAAGGVTTSMQRLSSGLKINSASDDAAGLNLSQTMTSQINASDIAKNNTQTGINLLQTMDSDLSQIGSLLQRMRDLSVQASNGVYSAAERAALNTENTQLIAEITRISDNSNFSQINLLSAASSITLQVGTNSGASNQLTINTYASDATDLGVNGNTLNTAANALTALGTCDTAIQTVSNNRAIVGATINRLEGTIQRTDMRKMNLESANSVILDADIALESATLTRSQILQQTAAALLSQANQMPTIALKLVQ